MKVKLFLIFCLINLSNQENADPTKLEPDTNIITIRYYYDKNTESFNTQAPKGLNQNQTNYFIYTIKTDNLQNETASALLTDNQTYSSLINDLHKYINTSDFTLNSFETSRNVSTSGTSSSLIHVSISLNINCDDDNLIENVHIRHNPANGLKLFNGLYDVDYVQIENQCKNQTHLVIYEKSRKIFGIDLEFLLAIIVPSVIIGSMLIVAICLACILHKTSKKYYRGDASSTTNTSKPIYKKQKAYLSKGVPVILYEEMNEKPIEEIDDLHLKPLIMRNEKPPTDEPAPPEYCKYSNTFDSFNNCIVDAPLAQAEMSNDDSYGLLQHQQQSDDLYQPPKPIIGLKDVSRHRVHINTNSESQQQETILP